MAARGELSMALDSVLDTEISPNRSRDVLSGCGGSCGMR